MSRWLIITGIILVITGVLVHFIPNIFYWFGKLPGDIRIESDKSKIFIPITSMLVVSVLLTLLINGISWLIQYFKN